MSFACWLVVVDMPLVTALLRRERFRHPTAPAVGLFSLALFGEDAEDEIVEGTFFGLAAVEEVQGERFKAKSTPQREHDAMVTGWRMAERVSGW
jgi:hypothetical protein